MSCKVSLEKLEDTLKQLTEQQTSMANDIKLKDLDLSQTKESYLKVLGAIEIVQFLKKRSRTPSRRRAKKLILLRSHDMLSEMNQERYKALRLLADHIRTPSRDLSLNAIFNDVKDEDLKWVTEKIHYYLLRLLEESDCEIEEEIELVSLME